jgi:NAD(P)-dependent dehydrogenase (short-subunit alcohol dehydrogenase family)
VSKPGQVEVLIQFVLGHLDGLVKNAGMQLEKSVVETTDTDWDRLIGADVDWGAINRTVGVGKSLYQNRCPGLINML